MFSQLFVSNTVTEKIHFKISLVQCRQGDKNKFKKKRDTKYLILDKFEQIFKSIIFRKENTDKVQMGLRIKVR